MSQVEQGYAEVQDPYNQRVTVAAIRTLQPEMFHESDDPRSQTALQSLINRVAEANGVPASGSRVLVVVEPESGMRADRKDTVQVIDGRDGPSSVRVYTLTPKDGENSAAKFSVEEQRQGWRPSVIQLGKGCRVSAYFYGHTNPGTQKMPEDAMVKARDTLTGVANALEYYCSKKPNGGHFARVLGRLANNP